MPYKHDIVLSLKSLELLTPTHPQFGQGPKKPKKILFLHLSLAPHPTHPIHGAMYIRRYLFWLLLSRFPIARMHNQCNEEKTVQARRRRRRWSECGTYLKPVFSTDLPVPHRVPAWHCSPPVWKNACQSSWCQPGIASIGGSQHQLCQNCCLCWSFWFQVSVTMFHPLQEMEWKNDVSWILIGFLLLEGKAKCLSSTLWQLEGGIGNIEFQSAPLFWLWMSML